MSPLGSFIQFFGGIHEIYFPYVLMKPILILAMIAGGMTGVFINVLFGVGLRAIVMRRRTIARCIQRTERLCAVAAAPLLVAAVA